MEERTEHDATLARYLLGSLPPAERDRIELQALADPVLFERLQVIEEDLIDAYVNEEMPQGDVALFETHFLNHPHQRERVEVAHCLRTVVERAAQAEAEPPPQVSKASVEEALANADRTPGWPWLAWAASLLVLILGGWLALQNLQLGQSLNQLQEERQAWTADRDILTEEKHRLEKELEAQQSQIAELDADLLVAEERVAELEKEPTEQAIQPPLTVAFVLGMGIRGSAGVPRLNLPETADRVELQVDVEPGGEETLFRALIANSAGDEIWGTSTLRPRGRALTVELPTAVLPPGRYVLTLFEREGGDFEEAGFFEFEVVSGAS